MIWRCGWWSRINLNLFFICISWLLLDLRIFHSDITICCHFDHLFVIDTLSESCTCANLDRFIIAWKHTCLALALTRLGVIMIDLRSTP